MTSADRWLAVCDRLYERAATSPHRPARVVWRCAAAVAWRQYARHA